jgi:hypothetical protein
MMWVSNPVLLIGLQLLDAWFFAVVAGGGPDIVPRSSLVPPWPRTCS